MSKNKTHKFRTLILLVLTLVLSITQTNVYANDKQEAKSNEQIIKEILKKSENEIEIDETEDMVVAKVTTDFIFSDDHWNDILDHGKKLELNFPDFMNISETIELLEPQTHRSFDTEENIDDSMIKVDNHRITLDFSDVEDKVIDFSLKYEISIQKDAFNEALMDETQYPIVAVFPREFLELFAIPEEVEDSLENDENDITNTDVENDDNTNIDEVEPESQSNKLKLTGDISLEFKGNPTATLKRNGRVVNEQNRISMNRYGTDDYTISINSDDSNQFKVQYKIKVNPEDLENITEEQLKDGVLFKYLKDDEAALFKYEYEFPEFMKFSYATGDSISASQKYSEQISTTLKRLDSESPNFKLVVEELTENVDDFEIFKFQGAIGAKLGEYIDSELKAGKSVDSIKDALINGIDLFEDHYNLNDYEFEKKPIEELENEIDYHLFFENLMNSQKDIDVIFPVEPKNGTDHTLKLAEDNFEIIPDGFIYRWEGVANTNRKNVLNTLDFAFTDPKFVESTLGWTVENKITFEYFTVLNDGTLIPYLVDGENQQTITNSDKSFAIDLENEKLAVKYHVERCYKNTSLNEEVEGKQSSMATVKLNKTLHNKSVENSHQFPKSIIITGNALDESDPTNLLWIVQYNNNGIVRNAGDGFDFELDKNSFQLQIPSGNEFNDYKKINPLEDMRHSIYINGKSLRDDDRFELVEDGEKIAIRIKEGITIDKKVTFTFNFRYKNRETLRDVLHSYPKVKFIGKADVHAFSRGEYQDRGELSDQEKQNLYASNILTLLTKKPVMIDYRTKEIIWGVSINTVTADRLSLPALTYTDTFGEGLKFEGLSDSDSIMMLRVDLDGDKSKASYDEFSKFKAEIKKILDDPDVKAEDLPEKINELLAQKIVVDDEKSKTYGDIITRINANNIATITASGSDFLNQEYAFSQPKSEPGYESHLPQDVIFGADEVKGDTKEHLLSGVDFRLDFIDSNKNLGGKPELAGDERAYYILYKTKLVNETPMQEVTNKAGILFADYEPGDHRNIKWVGGDFAAEQNLGEVAQYNTLPKKDGSVKIINDAETDRNRLAVQWNVTFNYDIDLSRTDKVLMTVTDTIDKTQTFEGFSLGNKDLVPENISSITLKAYNVEKNGELTRVENKDDVITKGEGLTITNTDTEIKYIIQKELDPSYVYKFDINTFIETSGDAAATDPVTDLDHYHLTGKFENKVGFKRKLVDGTDSEENFDEKIVELQAKNRIKKTAKQNFQSAQSRQRIDWTLTLNETYETMSDIKIVDKLENAHTFNNVKSEEDIENAMKGEAKLDHFSVEEYNPQTKKWSPLRLNDSDYTLRNLKNENKSLDDWQKGGSGFILTFNKTFTNPIRIHYSTYGRAMYKEELPLINHANITYNSNNIAKEHDVTARMDLRINQPAPGNNDELVDVGLQLRYNDNQPTEATVLNEGTQLSHQGESEVRVILYRYISGNLSNNFVYRIGIPDEEGKVEFNNVQKGHYVVKQFKTEDGYAVPNSLGFVPDVKNDSNDESVEIENKNANKLITLDLSEQSLSTRITNLIGRTSERYDFALYNITPTFKIHTKQNLYNNVGTMSSTSLGNNEVTVVKPDDTTQTFTSDENGLIQVGTVHVGDEAINFGDYRIKQENQINEGFLKNTEVLTHKIKQNHNGTISKTSKEIDFKNYKTALKMAVRDKDTHNVIKESTFELYKKEADNWIKIDDATSKGGITTQGYKTKNGFLELYNLDIGHYKLKQTSVDGYLLNSEELEFYAYGPDALVEEYQGAPRIMQLEFENIKSDVTFKNSINGQFISGSKFKLTNSDDLTSQEFTIADKEAGITKKLAPGNYTLEQISTAENRPVNKKKLEFAIEQVQQTTNSYTYEFKNHLGSFDFVTHTHNDETFTVSEFDIQRATSALAANTNTNLVAGSYSLNNVKVDDEWIYVKTNHEFIIPDSYMSPEELHKTVDVYATQATIPVVNYDGDTSVQTILNGAEFVLKNTASQELFESGESSAFIDVVPGTYDFSQTRAPLGYGKNTEVISNVVVPNQIATTDVVIDESLKTVEAYVLADLEFFNYRGSVRLLKKSAETQQPLAGIVFDLYHEDELVDRYTTNANGLIEVDALSPGNYYFVEISGDGQHLVTTNRVPFTIADAHAGAYVRKELEVLNYYANASFKNTNPDQTETYLDALFTLYKKANDQWDEVDGYINFSSNPSTQQFEMFGIEAGEYKLIQTKAPSSTIRNTFEYEFEIADTIDESSTGRVEIALDDYINYQAQITINLVDDQGAFTNAVDARLMDSTQRSHEIVQEGATLLLEHLDANEYTIALDKADGAIVVDEQLSFTVPEAAYNDEGLNLEGEARMTYACYKLSLQDGKTHQPLSSGELTINDQLYSFDEQGELVLSELTPQTYRVHQSKAADQYILNTLNNEEFVVYDKLSEFAADQINTQDYPYVDFGEKVLFNYQAELVVEKTDENNQPLAGVEFTLSDTKNTMYLISNQEGLLTTSTLAPGHYRLKESKALSGYQALNDVYEFDVLTEYAGEPEVIRLKIINEKIIDDHINTYGSDNSAAHAPLTGVEKTMIVYGIILVFALMMLITAFIRTKRNNQA